jgi:hypothetical protein
MTTLDPRGELRGQISGLGQKGRRASRPLPIVHRTGRKQLQFASVPVEDKILADAELDPPDDQLGTALVLEVAQDIEQAVAEGAIPLSDPDAEFAITPVPEARVRELIAADDTEVVHAGGLVFSFEQVDRARSDQISS